MKRVIVLMVIALIVSTGINAHNTVKKGTDLTTDYYEVNTVFKNSFYFTFASTYAMNGFGKNNICD